MKEKSENGIINPTSKILTVIIAALGVLIAWVALPREFDISVSPIRSEIDQGGTVSVTVFVRTCRLRPYKEDITLHFKPSSDIASSDIRVSFAQSGLKAPYSSITNITTLQNIDAGRLDIEIIGRGADGLEKTCTHTVTILSVPTRTPIPTPPPPPIRVIGLGRITDKRMRLSRGFVGMPGMRQSDGQKIARIVIHRRAFRAGHRLGIVTKQPVTIQGTLDSGRRHGVFSGVRQGPAGLMNLFHANKDFKTLNSAAMVSRGPFSSCG